MIVVHDDRVAEWVAAHIDSCSRGFGECRSAGVVKDGKIIGGVVYHNWCPEFETIELSAAAIDRRWLTRSVVHDLLAYPFGFCQMIFAQHKVTNPARAIWRKLGADEYVIPRLHGRNTIAAIATLTKEAWQAGKYYQGDGNG